MSSASIHADVTVAGAGLVGLSAALALQQLGLEVLLIDPHDTDEKSVDEADWDQRIYAISPQNVSWLQSLGVWSRLNPDRLTAVQAMQIWGDDVSAPLTLAAEDVNADAMAYIVEERALKQALWQQLKAQNLPTLLGVTASDLEINTQQARLQLNNGQVLQTKLLLAADGANSWLRQQAGITVTEKNYQQTAIVANFNIEKPHAEIARQWFRQEQAANAEAKQGSILAWLPLATGKVSIVWSVPTAFAEHLLGLDDEAFTQQVMQAGDAELGKMTLLGTRAAFPLRLKKADTLVQETLVLVGDAAHRIHPMAGQGVNLGFRDVIALTKLLSHRNRYQTLSDAGLFKQYSRARKADMLNMTHLTNGLYHLFGSQNAAVKKVRNWGLMQTNYPALRRILAQSAIAL